MILFDRSNALPVLAAMAGLEAKRPPAGDPPPVGGPS
jgi:hypothetical protein